MSEDIIPAASLILVRERAAGSPELLIVQRGAALTFAGGAYAFPGGRIDAIDRLLAAHCCPDHDPDDAAARVAAARETWEEVAIAVGLRRRAAGDAPLPEGGIIPGLLSDEVTLDTGAFTPFARWLPPGGGKRRFDTRFYLAAAPQGAEPRADGGETARAFWATAEDILARCRAGDGFGMFPTRRLLERIAGLPTLAAAREQARALPERIITPFVERRDDADWLCIPEAAGYPVTAERLDRIRRA